MSWLSGIFSRAGGETRCADELAANDDINAEPMDDDFNDMAEGINACLPADGSKNMAGNLGMAGYDIRDVATITGTPNMTGNATVQGLLTASGGATINSGASVFGGLSAYGGSPHLLDGDVLITGSLTFNNAVEITTGTFTPTVYGDSTPGTFSYSTQTGTYSQIGDDIYFNIHISGFWSVAPVGDIKIGIPHTIVTGGLFVINDIVHVDVCSDSNIVAQAESTNNFLTLHTYGTNGGLNAITAADQISVINQFVIQGRYTKA